MIEDILFLKSGHVDFNAAVIGIGRSRWEYLKPETSLDDAIQAMRQHRFDVMPIDEGPAMPVRECFHTKELNIWTRETVVRESITYQNVVPAHIPLYDLVQLFYNSKKIFFFLTYENRVSGLVSLANLNSRPVQVWLFAMLCELEARFSQLIKSCEINEADILNIISNDEIKNCLLQDRSQDIDSDITEYLYMKDLLKIVSKYILHTKIGYKSRREFSNLNKLVDMRNQVMHPVRSLIKDRKSIDKCWSRIELLQDALFRLRQIQN